MTGARRAQVAAMRLLLARSSRATATSRLHNTIPYVSSISSRGFRSSPAVQAGGKRGAADANEAVLEQQMLDFMRLAEAEEAADVVVEDPSGVQGELPLTGVVMDVQNSLARVSGLRHATIGSVVAIRGGEDELLCHGFVLFLEKKVAHVALLHGSDEAARARPVRIGMDVQMEHEQLEIPGSLARFAGAVINPLGQNFVFSDDLAAEDEDAAEVAANDRIHVTWGAQSVPGVMARAPLCAPFETGLLAVDCLQPLARGHRFGVMGPRNSGKTRVALDVIAHQVALAKTRGEQPPQFVYVCIGKSAARIHQIRDALKITGALEHTAIVAASDRDSPVLQYLAPFTGCAVAEFLMNHGKSPRSVVVYDDLATHTMVVEGLVQALRLPRAAQLSLSAHAVLMERSAQFKGTSKTQEGPSLTTLVLADAPDCLEVASEFQERVVSLVDDYMGLEASLARNRVFPPVDVLAPGASVRGPPFQSAARWTFVSRLRARINAAAQTKQNVEVARKLGFETEPEDAETLEFLELVQQFFTQGPRLSVSMAEPEHAAPTELVTELGAFFLTIVDVSQLPGSGGRDEVPLELWDFLRDVSQALERDESRDVLNQLTTHKRTQPWSLTLQENVAAVLLNELEALKQRRAKELKQEHVKRQQYLRKLRERKAGTATQQKA
ncbi:hypothetical protein BBJ28_00004033 [Nothophytophthora sp. Chile5]|nr:hypothetical protein BBJ28_00004033 [Nothophytophthora sp. Chile5]